MENYDKEASRLNRALQGKSFPNVKAVPRFNLPVMEIDPEQIMLEFADESQVFGDYEDLMRRIEAADSEEELKKSFETE